MLDDPRVAMPNTDSEPLHNEPTGHVTDSTSMDQRMIDVLAGLFEPVGVDEFLARFYGCVPYSGQGTARQLVEQVDWPVVDAILNQEGVDVVFSRAAERLRVDLRRGAAQARALFREGYTIGIRHAERHHELLKGIADAFARVFAGPVDVHVYCTPAGTHGFGWHYDAEEVFILQARGQKEYALRKNTVNPWPVVEAMNPAREFPAEIMPVMKCLLGPGDLLYIPSGYWHVGLGASGESISLAIGVMPATALAYLDFVRARLTRDVRWRARWRIVCEQLQNAACPLESLAPELDQLADELARTFASVEMFREFVAFRRSMATSAKPSDKAGTEHV